MDKVTKKEGPGTRDQPGKSISNLDVQDSDDSITCEEESSFSSESSITDDDLIFALQLTKQFHKNSFSSYIYYISKFDDAT